MFSGGSGRTIRLKAAVQSGGVMVDLNAALLPFDFCEDIIPSMLTYIGKYNKSTTQVLIQQYKLE